jgi:hypothetical protein
VAQAGVAQAGVAQAGVAQVAVTPGRVAAGESPSPRWASSRAFVSEIPPRGLGETTAPPYSEGWNEGVERAAVDGRHSTFPLFRQT